LGILSEDTGITGDILMRYLPSLSTRLLATLVGSLLPVLISLSASDLSQAWATELPAENPPQSPAAAVKVPVSVINEGNSLGSNEVKKLNFFGQGWEAEYNYTLDAWTLRKHTPNPATGFNDETSFYANLIAKEMPRDAKEFASKLKQEPGFLQFGFVWTEATIAESAPGSFVIRGIQKDIEDSSVRPAVVLLRTIDKKQVLFQSGYSVAKPELIDDIIRVAKSAQF
jgi:hypothetical protein